MSDEVYYYVKYRSRRHDENWDHNSTVINIHPLIYFPRFDGEDEYIVDFYCVIEKDIYKIIK